MQDAALFISFFGVRAKRTAYNKADTYLGVIYVHTASHLLPGAEFQKEEEERIFRTSSAGLPLQPTDIKPKFVCWAAHFYSCLAFFSFGECGLDGIVYCDPRIWDTQILYVIVSLAKITHIK